MPMKQSHPIPFNKSESWKMFNDISPKYDLLNRLLSFGLDLSWRQSLARQLPRRESLNVLDLATGTADVLITMCREIPELTSAYGIDRATNMLEIGKKKINRMNLHHIITLQEGDATDIPFPDQHFDACSISFGIRNVDNPSITLHEMFRVLKPGGIALILEFSLPQNMLIRAFHLFYLRFVVPCIGFLFSGNYRAYKYLNQTIEKFPYGKEFESLMIQNNFESVRATPLFFGAASIYQGKRPLA
jgi:demethylmenaquinone methyltransferase / 2-methoxy-6-polyprenyl-1,4-benzoquinol methylase